MNRCRDRHLLPDSFTWTQGECWIFDFESQVSIRVSNVEGYCNECISIVGYLGEGAGFPTDINGCAAEAQG
jgi:hypothetical protein